MRQNKLKAYQQEDGFVSIVVTLIIMIVLTLVVLSFAQLARREQRSALDRQLSTQAFYAAESGVNDAEAGVTHGNIPIAAVTGCDSVSGPAPTLAAYQGATPILNSQLNSTAGIAYTCLLMNFAPSSIDYTVTSSKVKIVPISNTNLTGGSLKFSWQANSNGTVFRAAGSTGQFTPTGSWGSDTGVLRVTIIPRASVSRGAYLNNSFTGFFYPEGVGAAGTVLTTPFPASGTALNSPGVVVSGSCNAGNTQATPLTPKYCNISVTGLANGGSGYIIVMRSIYSDSAVSISAKDSGGATVNLTGAQIITDVTGKANDVIRRIQVRRPINTNNPFLPIGFESIESICKQIKLDPFTPAVTDDPDNCTF